jgi:hypothetical protein
LYEVEHPHTGEMIADCIDKCLKFWEIPEEKVQLIVSDNGSNMVKAINVLRQMHIAEESESDSDMNDNADEDENRDEEDQDVESDDVEEDEEHQELPEHVIYRRMPCMAHTLQLIIKPV